MSTESATNSSGVSPGGLATHNQLAMNIRQTGQHLRRQMLAQSMGMEYGGKRDVYGTLGYPRDPSPRDYLNRYLRQDIARTIVNAPAETCWREFPNVKEDESDGEEASTPFEKDVEQLAEDYRLGHYLERADKLAGIGHYGVLVLGFADDPDSMSDPVDASELSGLSDLSYISPFAQTSVEDIHIEDDPTEPRYGLPREYKITYGDDNSGGEWTHYTRVIHVADGLLEDEVHGRPRLEGVLNRLIDLQKVIGGAAEMTWRGADRKFAATQKGEGQISNPDEMKEEVEGMVHGLEPVAYLKNLELESFGGETVDPSGIGGELLKLISGETGIPKRILTGSERGELASTQDRATFYGRMAERRTSFCEPQMLRPLIDRLIAFGVISPPSGTEVDGVDDGDVAADYVVDWTTLFELNAIEEAEVRVKNANALSTSAPMGDTGMVATKEEIREKVMDWSPELGSETTVDVDSSAPGDVPEDGDARDVLDQWKPDEAETPPTPGDGGGEGEAVTDGGTEPEE